MVKEKFKGLMDKYWEGTSSLEEESLLREFLSTPKGQNDYPDEAAIFGYFASQMSLKSTVTSFPMEKVTPSPKPKVVKLIPIIRSIAAALLILLGGYFVWIQYPTTQEKSMIVIEDPKEALKITQEALAFLSKNVDKGEVVLKQNLAKLSFTKILK